ncbi:hypothetical protein K8Q94_01450, partial [Candidatus Nomurabacteria bacterium]|nr:hypothetical protein [Candidatus Nomurabacteria bacterium]
MKIINKILIMFVLIGAFLGVSNSTLASSSPTLVSASAINITKNSATLSGTINPNGLTTTAWYEMPDGGPFQTQNLLNGT